MVINPSISVMCVSRKLTSWSLSDSVVNCILGLIEFAWSRMCDAVQSFAFEYMQMISSMNFFWYIISGHWAMICSSIVYM